jgi:hypothetical protein
MTACAEFLLMRAAAGWFFRQAGITMASIAWSAEIPGHDIVQPDRVALSRAAIAAELRSNRLIKMCADQPE